MSDDIRKLAPEILDRINKSQRILLHCHTSPDPDSIGSVLAMGHFLNGLKKTVTIIAGDSKLPKGALCLPGADKIIPKNIFEINLTEFDLFLILDSSDISRVSRLQPLTFPPGLATVVIDHHVSNTRFGQINLIDSFSPATGQIVYELISLWRGNITPDMAVCLLVAIQNDSGGFSYPQTSSSTFLAAGALAKIAPDFPAYLSGYNSQNDPQWLYFQGLALNSVKLFFDSRVAVSLVRYEQLAEKYIREYHTENSEIANMLKSVSGWDIGISFIERNPGVISVSFRTRDAQKYDVSRIALATGSGGGHRPAAGATLKMPFDQALPFLLAVIKKTYPELGDP